ncbi:hypothetical protein TCAL_08517 [Tigriopus californicus]|uniref:Peptidase S1 domain-containing protein n=2 Tax=Tigriopus californicus TaxID=6832 RepID=A0A553PL06_TIGCA|nr:hypothetical protein TCAL_08517 [Tigriopus californicus]|eukprot:TCALIF_08517-PA protein Name:"Similar to CELA1 Chymotrypsin-like elastase family member 1 (Felis catus)" AED:0.07 eAED:0.07 QI:291/1/1/1/0.66/0.5/4/14/330
MVITCSQLQVPCSFNDQLWISELSVTSVGCFPTTEALTDVFFTYKKLSASSRMSLIYRADQNSPVTTGMVCNIQNQGPRGTGSSTTKRPPPVQTCGGPPSASSRIIDGTLVADNEFGFMAKLTIDDLYLCGASVLNSRWLLTAAHCVKPSSSVVASFDCIGSVNCRQSRTQDQIYIHPNWDDSNVAKGFDVALIQLSQDIQFSNAVWPVCLPANPPNFGENMKVIGFGNIATNGPTSQDLLMGFVKVEPMSTCRRFFGNGLGSTVFCASQNPSSTCRGDSGSFGGVRRNGRFEIDGITSFGGAICEDDPMGFMLVVSEKEWINSYINILV